MILTFVINGEPVRMRCSLDATLASVRDRALAASRQTGRPASAWELRRIDGTLLALEGDPTIRSCGFPPKAEIFLTVKVGAGGIGEYGESPHGIGEYGVSPHGTRRRAKNGRWRRNAPRDVPDFLQSMIASQTRKNPDFPRLMQEAEAFRAERERLHRARNS